MKKTFIKNAVLRKDMLLDMKKPKIMIIMLLFNLLLCVVALPFVSSTILMTGSESVLSYRTMITMYMVLVWLETIAICFLTPALTAGCVSIEKERQTMDVLLTTRMSTWQIIVGKYFSSIMLVIMLIISGLPMMALVFIYGGVNIAQMFLMALVLITTTIQGRTRIWRISTGGKPNPEKKFLCIVTTRATMVLSACANSSILLFTAIKTTPTSTYLCTE